MNAAHTEQPEIPRFVMHLMQSEAIYFALCDYCLLDSFRTGSEGGYRSITPLLSPAQPQGRQFKVSHAHL